VAFRQKPKEKAGATRSPADGATRESRRILVLGSRGHSRQVRAYAWDGLPEQLNVADFDVVILNLAAFADDPELAAGMPRDRLPARDAFTRLIFSSGSEVIAVGDPRTLIGPPAPAGSPSWHDPRARADYFLPGYLDVEDSSGEAFSVETTEWREYFDQLSRYSWIVTKFDGAYGEPEAYLRAAVDAHRLQYHAAPVAQTRFGKAIALRVRFIAERATATDRYGGLTNFAPVAASGDVVWLPQPDRCSSAEGIDLLLRERYGIKHELRAPDWAADYVLPNEAPIGREIATIKSDIRRAEDQLAEAEGRLAAARRPRVLLYEKGKEALEPVVREALRELGARVEDPQQDGIEDGLLFYNDDAGVLEIKGRRNQVKQDDVRQVSQWASDARLRDGQVYKPVIVANALAETPVHERADPVAPNAAQFAVNGDVAIVTTAHIFEALRQLQAGEFEAHKFWSEVFSARGLADLPLPDNPSASSSPT
jgi:hypothetical protein